MTKIGPLRFHDSFPYAWDGLYNAISTQRNFQFMVLVGILALLLGYVLGFDAERQLIILGTTLLVLMVELINTAIEKMNDAMHDAHNQNVKLSKDSAAAASLLVTLISGIVGLYLFLPPLAALILGI